LLLENMDIANLVTEAGRKAAEERARKRAEALRANLKRRKAAEQAADHGKGEKNAEHQKNER
jgi:hypothetical protein